MLKIILYPKNVPTWERILRVVLGAALTLYAAFGNPSTWLLILSLGSAIFVIATGFIGWCPMCALVGRKIKEK